MTTSHNHSKYISNPFKLMFDGFSRLYNVNQNMTIVLLVLSVLSSFGGYGGSYPSFGGNSSGTEAMDPAIVAMIVGVILIFAFVALVGGGFIYTMFSGMAAHVAWNTSQNKTVTFEESFKTVLKKFWRIFFINFIVFWKIFGGLLLFIIPGIRAMLRYQMVLFPVFESDADPKEAIATSKAITKNHLIEVFGLSFAAGIIPLVGGVLKIGGHSIMYSQLRDLQTSGAEKPKVHWLNYLGFFLITGFVLFISFITLIAVWAIKYS